jgi:hypothetical protein
MGGLTRRVSDGWVSRVPWVLHGIVSAHGSLWLKPPDDGSR